ncbi:response regulator [bacterium]|nr:response regulator [bacterium]NUN44691.1 response regulator [bacterium]HMW34220.1 response regulator [bacterium]HMW34762.1 response regulator [bacterium]HMZ03554.1 response regulator [bacterium]
MKKIVIIDDDQDFVSVAGKVLSHIGKFDVVAHTDSSDAMDLIRREKPDLIIVDIMMPKVDGFTILRNVRTSADLQHIKVIVCSAKIFDVDKKNALKLGANEYISKITAASELVDKVNAVLGTV